MRICLIGKFPPIQGGVSMRTFWTAHALARRGHDVEVVTNAKEAQPPFRMHMRSEDWGRCEATYGRGRVRVHWSDPVDRAQSYLPMASPFVSKLAGIAARVHAERPCDVIYSHYLEPYGVAAHLAAQITGVPHVVRMAGSDAGRLWHHPQLEPLYDHVLRAASVVIAAGSVAERAIARGVDPECVRPAGAFVVPEELFTPVGPLLDLTTLRRELDHSDARDQLWGEFAGDRSYFGIAGKLGERKGSFALLAAMQRLREAGLDCGLVALAHGQPDVEARFRAEARERGLMDRVLQIPFLPHWRVPEFLRGCLAVCCLEQDFPIAIHTPIVALEVLLCGRCLVGSTEVIRKLPGFWKLPHKYGCVAIADVNNIEALAERLAAIIKNPAPAAAIGARGCAFARELQNGIAFPQILEQIFASTASRKRVRRRKQEMVQEEAGHFPLTTIAATVLAKRGKKLPRATTARLDLARARRILAEFEHIKRNRRRSFDVLAAAVRIEVALAQAELEAAPSRNDANYDPLFRVCMEDWALKDGDIASLIPLRDPSLRVLRFDFDVAPFRGVSTLKELPIALDYKPSHLAVFTAGRREPLLVDGVTAHILDLCDGARSVDEIIAVMAGSMRDPKHIRWIENMFACGLIGLQQKAEGTMARGELRSAQASGRL
ncbi:MAG: glycosyltransferase [Xanthobacteraceae bacterium]|nr:glycosyltransferase [Xanthobacteraceae bacterium]